MSDINVFFQLQHDRSDYNSKNLRQRILYRMNYISARIFLANR